MEELITRVVAALTAAGLTAQAASSSAVLKRVNAVRFAVSLKQVQCVPGAVYDYYGQRSVTGGGSVSVFGKRMTAEVTVTALAPSREAMPAAVSDAADALSGGVSGASLKKLTVGETAYLTKEDAFACELTLQYSAVLYAESSEDEPEYLTFRLGGEVQ